MRILILLLSIGMAQVAFAQEAQQPPPVQPPPQQQQTEPAAPSPPAVAPAGPVTPAPPAASPAPAPAAPIVEPPRVEQGTEYWPPIRGYRLKITDTLIVGFMALLFWATWLLWRASQRLVKNAERNAERQLRAYLAVIPKGIGGFRPNVVGRIEWLIKTLGQTPAQKITHRYSLAVLPHPLPPRHKFADPAREIANTAALLPKDETLISFEGDAFTAEQIEAISRNAARIHCWGATEYEDIFYVRWRSRFAVSVGGEAFARAVNLPADHPSAPAWSWEYGSGHNEIEQAR